MDTRRWSSLPTHLPTSLSTTVEGVLVRNRPSNQSSWTPQTPFVHVDHVAVDRLPSEMVASTKSTPTGDGRADSHVEGRVLGGCRG